VTIGTWVDGAVGVVELQRPPHNVLTPEQVEDVASAFERFDDDLAVGAVLLCAQGRSFCAGADFGARSGDGLGGSSTERLYAAAARLVEVGVPVVAAVQGPAIGGGLGLAMTASLRVTCPEARFSANFVKLGIHQGFGLSVTLPELLGPSRAALVLLSARRFGGEEATELGLADACVPADELRASAMALAAEVASSAPLALRAVNRTLRAGLGERIRVATAHEAAEQARLGATEDAREGMRAVAERRPGSFSGR
jgi:enoyl-CoA hydratase/carnithine racemase